MNDSFKLLGLDQETASVTDVKKAYAAKLKITRPDDDPQGFMALREAFTDAKAHAKWREDNPPEKETLPTEISNEQSHQEIKYWYDEELQYNFNSSPLGKIIEKTVRWIKKDFGTEPETFFDLIAHEPGYQSEKDRHAYENFLLGYIYYQAGGEDYYDYYDDYDENTFDPEEVEFVRPDWLTDEVILTINNRFGLLGKTPEYEWDAWQINCIKILFEPVLIENQILEQRSQLHDIWDFRAKEVYAQRKDEYGSYYDKKQRKWIDKSPVSVAMSDIETLVSQPWGAGSLNEWKKILTRDNLQAIDEFQTLDNRLKHFIINKTGFGNEKAPVKPNWMTDEVLKLFDNTFGWSHQTVRSTWEYDQFQWLLNLIENKSDETQRAQSAKTVKSWESIDKKSYEYLGYQPLPFILNPIFIVVCYVFLRLYKMWLG